eukprot:4865244-Amphidinium_carterae.1
MVEPHVGRASISASASLGTNSQREVGTKNCTTTTAPQVWGGGGGTIVGSYEGREVCVPADYRGAHRSPPGVGNQT